MARCPFAVWRPLPENQTEPDLDASQLVLHTAVDAPGPTSLEGWWNVPGNNIESHFFVRMDGTIEQYMDTSKQADAQRYGNSRAISIETEDDGKPETTPWNEAQLQAIIRLGRWILANHPKIAHRVCRSWTDPGIGYHSMWGAPSVWTPAEGKTCPGAARIAQFPSVVAAITDPDKPIPTPSLTGEFMFARKGDFTDAVEFWQRRLHRLGHYDGDFDRDYGPKTVAAVKEAMGGRVNGEEINPWIADVIETNLDRKVARKEAREAVAEAEVRSAMPTSLRSLDFDDVGRTVKDLPTEFPAGLSFALVKEGPRGERGVLRTFRVESDDGQTYQSFVPANAAKFPSLLHRSAGPDDASWGEWYEFAPVERAS